MRQLRFETRAVAWQVPLLALAAAAPMAWTEDAAVPAAAVTEPSDATSAERPSAQPEAQSTVKESAPDEADEKSPGTEGKLDVETILSNPLDDEAYRERRTCLRPRAVDRVEILNDSLVLFHVRRNKAWLNKLSSPCLGLERDMIVNLRIFGGSVCRLDSFRGLTRAGDMHATAHCRLGDFEAIEGAQIEALRTALKEQREAAALERKARRAERRERRKARRK